MTRTKIGTLRTQLAATAFAVFCLGLVPVNSPAQNYAQVHQLNPVLQSLGYFGTPYTAGSGYYGGYTGTYPYSGPVYSQRYYPPTYSLYPSPYRYGSSYRNSCSPRPTFARPLTTMVPTDLTRDPPKFANPWFTSPGYRERQGFSGR